MTFATNAIIDGFGDGQVLVTGTTASIATGAYSVVGDTTPFTNTEEAIIANMVLLVTFASAPTAGRLPLFARQLGIRPSIDQGVPNDNFPYDNRGVFLFDALGTQQAVALDITLPNAKTSAQYQFFIKNDSDQAINANWSMYINTKASTPKPAP